MAHIHHSIPSMDAGRKLLAQVMASDAPALVGPIPDGTGRRDGITLEAWRLTRLGKLDRRGERTRELSGGVRIIATTRVPEYGGMPLSFARRLRPGWTAESFVRAASRCFMEARAACHRMAYAEQVYGVAEPLRPGELEAVEAEETASGRTAVYANMSPEAAIAWLDWFDRQRGGSANARSS